MEQQRATLVGRSSKIKWNTKSCQLGLFDGQPKTFSGQLHNLTSLLCKLKILCSKAPLKGAIRISWIFEEFSDTIYWKQVLEYKSVGIIRRKNGTKL